jgi:Protein of unknown function (DUF3632)
MARMSREGLIKRNMYAIDQLQTALEEQNSRTYLEEENYVIEIVSNISVASEWIIRNGLRLYSERLGAESLDKDAPWTSGNFGSCDFPSCRCDGKDLLLSSFICI